MTSEEAISSNQQPSGVGAPHLKVSSDYIHLAISESNIPENESRRFYRQEEHLNEGQMIEWPEKAHEPNYELNTSNSAHFMQQPPD